MIISFFMGRAYTPEGLDEVVAAVRGKKFEDVAAQVRRRTDFLLSFGSTPLAPEGHALFDACYYRAVQAYASASPRRLQGDYLQHPEEVVAILRETNISDAILLGVGLLHDAIEEEVAAERKRRKMSSEEEKERINELSIDLLYSLAHDLMILKPFGASDALCYALAEQVCEPVGLMTRPSGEQYYKSVGTIFRAQNLVHEESKSRAIIAKGKDRQANTNRLDSQAYREPGAEFQISYESVIRSIEENQGVTPRSLSRLARMYAQQHPQDASFEYTSAERLHQCFKNLVFITEYRLMRLAEVRISEVHHLDLAQATKREADKVVNHNCTYHCADGILNPRKVWEIHNQEKIYEAAGGFHSITQPLPYVRGRHRGFDGIFKTFFDARVHGNTEILEYMQRDKALLVRVGRAISRICELYLTDDMYVLSGLSASGLEPIAPRGK